MEKIDFYYFSATGNTALVVKRMTEFFNSNGFQTELHRIEKTDPHEVQPEGMLGIGFPVAMQGTYPFVWEFIENLPEAAGTPVFMVDTLQSFSGGIVGPVRKILTDKGYLPIGACEISMPNSRRSRQDPVKNRLKVEKGLIKAVDYAEKITLRQASWKRIPVFSDWMAGISRKPDLWRVLGKKTAMTADASRCTQCGLCIAGCPTGNIQMNPYPVFGNTCVACMRCFSACPAGAVHPLQPGIVRYRAEEP